MVSLEQAFRDTERAAGSVSESARRVGLQARALARASKTGNISAMKRAQAGLDDAVNTLMQNAANASHWSLSEDEEEQYMADGYSEELRRAAGEQGLDIYERDGNLVSYPSIVRIIPRERAVRIDRKKVSNIRPSHLAGQLVANQKRTSGFSSARFLESLYAVYDDITRGDASSRMVKSGGEVVRLSRIYSLLTSLPGASREYGRGDFARDLYVLDSDGPSRTRRGAEVSFPSSTGTRTRQSDLFEFIGPDGHSVTYYGISFREDG